MADAANIRSVLSQTDGSAEAIQQAARAMMKQYDRSTIIAVTEWRNVLHQARSDQYLPLLYVANETLQNSKRNRGNKFLEAFSPILGQALTFICQKNPSLIEKVRRTVKIWGDRHVFSIRYVNELLKGLEHFRNADYNQTPPVTTTMTTTAVSGDSSPVVAASFSPLHAPPPEPAKAPPVPNRSAIDIDRELSLDVDDSLSGDGDDNDDDTDDDDDLFGDSGDRLLNIDLDLDKAASAAKKEASNGDTTTAAANRKRRRPSVPVVGPNSTKRRNTILSTHSLMELWNQVATLQQRFDSTQTILADIQPESVHASMDLIDTLVGDELEDAYKKNQTFQKRVVDQRIELHSIAKKRRSLEQEAVRYLPWLEAALKQDADDIEFCDKVLLELTKFQPLHAVTKAAREKQLAEEARRQRVMEEEENKKKEVEDRKKFMEIAMAKQTEAKPGMVWNKAAGEYQYRSTDESWRD